MFKVCAEAPGKLLRDKSGAVLSPDPKMPIHGLYLVGADAGGRGIGTEMAGESALYVSRMTADDVTGQ